MAKVRCPTCHHAYLCIYNIYIYTQHGNTALALAVGGNHGKVVGVLIGAGMAAGQWPDVNACLGSVLIPSS